MTFKMYRMIGVILLILASINVIGQPTSQKGPNIIYIMADDLGYGDLGCYGQKKLPTPNIDKMASEGLRFTQFYAGSTVCAPSRCALMTGKHMGNAYIRGNTELPLRETDTTLAEMMKSRNYITGMFGKWGLGREQTTGSPEKQGWDHFFGYLDHRHAHRYNVDHLWKVENGNLLKQPVDSSKNSNHMIVDAAANFIRDQKAKPFFLYLAITLPHAEMIAPNREVLAKYLDKAGKSIFEETPYNRKPKGTYRSQAMPNASFAAMISQLDSDVGKILSLLKELKIDKNTYVFFTSDNGPHGEGGHTVEYFDSNGILRGKKRDLYEGGIRVPMIIWGHENLKRSVINEPLANWDILPTLMELTGDKLTSRTDGISFAPVLKGKKLQQSHKYLYWEFYERGFDQAVRVGKWKLIKKSKQDSTVELFNIDTDPKEAIDLASKYPAKVKQLQQIMSAAHTDSENFKHK